MTDIIPSAHDVKPGDEMHFHNRQNAPIRIRVTTQCGTETEAELHPGAVFRLVAGTASAKVDILPPAEKYIGIKAVD